ncbi:MAG: PEP-CTERM sorting domain-containing protein [Planctomycetes bacterium]|nr:PEP-CTERM sorting domain-containing protein [Planctomycetota bacterium]
MKRFITIAVLVFVFSSAASATLMTWNDDNGNYGYGFYDIVKIFSSVSPYNDYTVRAGELDVTYGGVDYMGYCVDVMQGLGDYDVTVLLPTSDPLLTASYLYETEHSNVSSNVAAAALQVAIWEIISENYGAYGYDVTDSTSNFYIANNTAVSLAANNLLNGLAVPIGYSPAISTKVLASTVGQDVMVPEPSTIILLGLGGLFFMKKRKA